MSVPSKIMLHPNNKHKEAYDFERLIGENPQLEPFVFTNSHGTQTVDFSSSQAVLQLNKALLKKYYEVSDWGIPPHYLCPPIPGRADYIHYLADLLAEDKLAPPITGLDIGVGANCIYPILGAQIYNWKMVGADIDVHAVTSARKNGSSSDKLKEQIDIRHQKNNANIFEGIILENEYYHFTMCNPPFHASEEDARKGTFRKLRNLQSENVNKNKVVLNFGGQANELWCNGGEALFIKRMIKQSVAFKSQVAWFSTLVSKKDNLKNIYKQLNKVKATHKTISMSQGKKKSRFVAWKYQC